MCSCSFVDVQEWLWGTNVQKWLCGCNTSCAPQNGHQLGCTSIYSTSQTAIKWLPPGIPASCCIHPMCTSSDGVTPNSNRDNVRILELVWGGGGWHQGWVLPGQGVVGWEAGIVRSALGLGPHQRRQGSYPVIPEQRSSEGALQIRHKTLWHRARGSWTRENYTSVVRSIFGHFCLWFREGGGGPACQRVMRLQGTLRMMRPGRVDQSWTHIPASLPRGVLKREKKRCF